MDEADGSNIAELLASLSAQASKPCRSVTAVAVTEEAIGAVPVKVAGDCRVAVHNVIYSSVACKFAQHVGPLLMLSSHMTAQK